MLVEPVNFEEMKKHKEMSQSKEKSLDLLEKQNKEYLEHLQRLQAEFENYQKRIEREKAEQAKYSASSIIKKFLNILDDIRRALESWKKDNLKDEHTNGLEMVYKNFYKILEEEGLRTMDCVDKKFDPYMHEVVTKIKSDKPEGTILEETQKGYLLKDKVIRHAKVIISAGEQ